MVQVRLLNSIRSNKRLWQVILPVAILELAFLLRIWGLGAESAWIDEAYSIELAKHNIREIILGTAADQHPPLYYLLLHIWFIFGTSVGYARLLSAIIGTIHVSQTILLGKKFAGHAIGLLSGMLLAVSPLHVWYSQEARMYILLASLTTASCSVLWSGLHGKGRWLLYMLFSSLAMYTHYFAVFIIFSQGIFIFAWSCRFKSKEVLANWAISTFFTGLVFLPWLPVAINQTLHHTMSWISTPDSGVVMDTLLRLIASNAVMLIPAVGRWCLSVALVGLFVWTILQSWRRNDPQRWMLYYLFVWGIVPFIAIGVVSLFYPIYQFKQFLLVLAPLLILSIMASRVIPRQSGWFFIAALLTLSAITLIYQQFTLSKDDWRGATSYVQIRLEPGDVVFGNPAASEFALSLYAKKPLPFQGVPADYSILTGGWKGKILTPESAAEQLLPIAQANRRVWLIEYFPEFWDPNQTLPSWLNQHAILQDDHFFVKIRIRLYKFSITAP